MFRRCALSCLGVVMAASAFAGDASALTFGGGLLSQTLPGPHVFRPTAGVSFRFDGRPWARFDTGLKCGNRAYDIYGHGPMTVSGSSISATGTGRLALGAGRLTYRWNITGSQEGSRILGVLQVVATRHVKGRPAESCPKARRGFAAIQPVLPAGKPARPTAPTTYFGLSDSRLAGTHAGSVVVRVSRSGHVTARWEAVAPCDHGPAVVFTNYTPGPRAGASGGFSRAEHFSIRYSDSLIRYRVGFGGHLYSDGAATGTLRLAARVFENGRLVARCDSGRRTWTARDWASARSAA